MSYEELKKQSIVELRILAKQNGVKSVTTMKKEELIQAIIHVEKNSEPSSETVAVSQPTARSTPRKNAPRQERSSETMEIRSDSSVPIQGIFELVKEGQDGFGFIRTKGYFSDSADIFVSSRLISKYKLRTGDEIKGLAKDIGDGSRSLPLVYLQEVNGSTNFFRVRRANFDDLIPEFPNHRFSLFGNNHTLSCKAIEMLAPIGRGQRALIVAPPKAGKTTILKDLAKAIAQDPGAKNTRIIILLIDERPEEVTDIRDAMDESRVEVVASTFDETIEHHTHAAEMVLERSKRLVEQGQDVVILLDSITRLARAYNLAIPSSGKTLSGGLDPASLYYPKKFFGAARNIRQGGSLTIIATALVDTGSRLDDVIYEEFKGTGNMELTLDRSMQERHIFPAIDVKRSGTRRDDLLLSAAELGLVEQIRDQLAERTLDQDYWQLLNKY